MTPLHNVREEALVADEPVAAAAAAAALEA
jgi:hypothetical protein